MVVQALQSGDRLGLVLQMADPLVARVLRRQQCPYFSGRRFALERFGQQRATAERDEVEDGVDLRPQRTMSESHCRHQGKRKRIERMAVPRVRSSGCSQNRKSGGTSSIFIGMLIAE